LFIHDRPVRFEEIDAAQILFFSRFLNYCHEAMEALLAPLDGGYARLILERRLGLPAVHVDVDFASPLRFGDVARLAVTVRRLGKSSIAFRYVITRAKDGAAVATVNQVCALIDLETMRAVPLPDDVRATLAAHLEPDA
jgi:4-hydroxybenzoyl-CoA thioesterase